ncbi:hypothetical protein JCGZ_08473 [Jatropha curcas]|uniref:ABC transporter domain-containing protein n=1 Tax=Jatropha curcas TaxID=180498 RepID=A0A067LDD3_JATCU|nr:hypothetical protein JCGZ_08473 [Jatropha curcas]
MAAALNGTEYLEVQIDPGRESFARPSNADSVREDEAELQWQAIARLPSQKRSNFSLLRRSSTDYSHGGEESRMEMIDVTKLDRANRELVVRKALATNTQDNYKLLSGIKQRLDNAGLEAPKVEVRFEHLNLVAKVQTGSRALPTLINAVRDTIEGLMAGLGLFHPNKLSLTILNDVSGVIKPGRMTLLLGPPGSGKSTLLLALAGKLAKNIKKSGNITYNGHKLDEFYVKRTSAYISQIDNHIAELTVRETLDFAASCQGASESFAAYMEDLLRLEKEKNIRPSPEIDAFMKASSVAGKKHSVSTDYVLKLLGLDVCSETIVGEMIVGPRKTLFMDEISTGLDSSTTYQIVKCIGNFVHQMDGTVLMALLQPPPETFDMFDDLILLSEGYMVYQGPRAEVLEFFESLGFQLPPRKGIADFLQEVTSKKDQAQYWADPSKPYVYMPVPEIARAFENSRFGKSVESSLSIPFDKSKSHPSALSKTRYAVSIWELFKACFAREILLINRHRFLYCFRTFQFFTSNGTISFIPDGHGLCPVLFFVYHTLLLKLLYGLVLYTTLLVLPLLLAVHQMALGLFRMMASIARDMVIANTFGSASLLIIFLLGGFIIPKDSIKPWWIWAFWVSPLSYGQRAISVNEFGAERWMKNSTITNNTIGYTVLREHSLPASDDWYWIGIGVLWLYAVIFNIGVTCALTYLNPILKAQTVADPVDSREENLAGNVGLKPESNQTYAKEGIKKTGMILPFQPLTMTFHNVNYFVDMPKEMTKQGVPEKKLQLLSNVSGVFSPGVLTALVGSSGAGKTTLMDVLAGRKTGGYIEGSIKISGYIKEQRTFARVSGYVEQNDIHSPQVTIEESLWFSSSLRLPKEVTRQQRHDFVEEVMRLVELDTLRQALVGLPGTTGLSTEQRKRLTIAVELVANPSIIFMDEPTSGLDARAAAIVMRTVRNTVDTGRTVVCTIHQPSIDIFEAFDELLLMKRGGQVIYGGKLGVHSQIMIDYFQGFNGIPQIPDGYNPATWMLEVTTPAVEERIGEDFADLYKSSMQYREVEESIMHFSTPPANSNPLKFDSTYAQDSQTQFRVCLRKQNLVYWRSPRYNTVRLLYTMLAALILGSVFWKIGSRSNASSVQPIVSVERTVFYRERAAGMYSPLAYALAQGLVEIPYILMQTILYGFITYFMIGFEIKAGKFFLYLVFMFLTFTYFTFYGMMAVGLTPSQHMSAVISSAFYSLWNLLSGFLIPKPRIPAWWIWFHYINPIAWTLRGIITSQLGDAENKIIGPGFEGSIKDSLSMPCAPNDNNDDADFALKPSMSAELQANPT